MQYIFVVKEKENRHCWGSYSGEFTRVERKAVELDPGL
jgi:hypothetical protein